MAKHCNSQSEFDSALRSSGGKLVVVDFHATWCGPCKVIAPTFESLAKSYSPSRANFLKIDVDAVPSVASSYGVRAMPTFLFLKNGKVIETLKGANSSQLTKLVEQLSKEGAGGSLGSFTGTGHTLAGGSTFSSSTSGGPSASLIDAIKNMPMENLLPIFVVVAYLAYVFFGSS